MAVIVCLRLPAIGVLTDLGCGWGFVRVVLGVVSVCQSLDLPVLPTNLGPALGFMGRILELVAVMVLGVVSALWPGT